MVPGRLPEHGKRKRVRPKQPRIRPLRRMDVGEKLRPEQLWSGLHRLEGPHTAEYFAAIVSCHPDWSNLGGMTVRVEIRRTAHVGASVGEIHGTLGVIRKARKELLSYGDHFVGLSARAGHLAPDNHVPAVSKRPAEGVAGKRSGRRLVPCHNHPGIETPRQGHPDSLPAVEVTREVLR